MDPPITLHATCVAIRGIGVLIAGASGTGKSDLALRLIDRGAMLVSDDYTELTPTAAGLIASPPATIAGKLEIRGIGLVEMPHVESARIGLYVGFGTPERMPHRAHRIVAGVAVPELIVSPFEASTPIKVELALAGIPE
jgi:hypothetical protein